MKLICRIAKNCTKLQYSKYILPYSTNMTLSIQDHVILGMSILKATYHQPTKPTECYLNKHATRIWMEGYGVRPEVAYEAWLHIRREAATKGVQIHHLYWTFHFMKTYQSENNVARSLDTNAKTLRERVKSVMKMLSRAMSKVVRIHFISFYYTRYLLSPFVLHVLTKLLITY